MTPSENKADKQEVREWWICQTIGYDGDAYDTDPDTWMPPGNKRGEHRHKYHVIEYSAYQTALARIEKLETALKFYADGNSWYRPDPTESKYYLCSRLPIDSVDDGVGLGIRLAGQVARQALESP